MRILLYWRSFVEWFHQFGLNQYLFDLTDKKILDNKKNILKKLNLDQKTFNLLIKKLKNYRYIDELPELKDGSYIRWISLKNPYNVKLTNGGIVIEIKVHNNGIIIVCKNNLNNIFQLNMTENLIFQKMNQEEMILISALNYLNK